MRWLVVAVALCVASAEDEPLECPCGLDDKPWPSTPPKDQALVFLHVPKAGTSWTVTMAQVPAACHGVSSAGLGAAMRRCVREGNNFQEECAFEVLHGRSPRCMNALKRSVRAHQPLSAARAPPDRYVAMFREPVQRLASLARMAQANQARGSRNLPGAGSSTYADILYARLPNLTRATFSEQPEVLGCATRMLTGFPCVGPTTVLAEDVRAAVAAVSKLGFVGLTERWTESVCLFHRTFGLPRPKRAQALNSRAGNIYGEEERGAARDPADEAVYAEAARVFAARLRAVWIPNLQPDFNLRVIERFGPDSFAVLRELDESNRFVQKSAESTSI